MAVFAIKLGGTFHLEKGQSTTGHWKHLTPSSAVWYIQAIPLENSFTDSPPNQSVEVEVTRVWRQLNRTESPGSEFTEIDTEHEVWWEVKNVGSRPLNAQIYASIVAP
jgi:hypothetical protein